MKIARKSPLTGKTNIMDLPVTEEQIWEHLKSGRMIQDSFPNLTPDQREFLLTGYTKEDWDTLFEEEE